MQSNIQAVVGEFEHIHIWRHLFIMSMSRTKVPLTGMREMKVQHTLMEKNEKGKFAKSREVQGDLLYESMLHLPRF